MKSLQKWVLAVCLGTSLFANNELTAQLLKFSDVTTRSGIMDIDSISSWTGNGASIADFDLDGDLDIYLCTTLELPDQLYQNQGNGEFLEVGDKLGLASTNRNRTALWFDYDGDHLLDLVTVGDCYRSEGCQNKLFVTLYRQTSSGQFNEVTADTGLSLDNSYETQHNPVAGGLTAGDINDDGYLDLLITIWGGYNALFLNNEDGTFSDISKSSGIGENFGQHWQPMMFDFDGDHDLDIYCNVDFGPNQFWENLGNEKFEEKAAAYGMDSFSSEMGMTLGDYDNDGDMDIYITNITQVNRGIQEHNVLLQNNSTASGLVFDDVARDLGVGFNNWDWGTTFFDADNDGWLDLTATNGWNDNDFSMDSQKLWLNINQGEFEDVTTESRLENQVQATTLLAFDMDRDGDLDLLQTLKENEGDQLPVQISQNHLIENGSENGFLVVKPRMSGPNHYAIGTVLRLQAGDLNSMRLITAGTSFYGQEPAETVFGTGSVELINELIIEWPDHDVDTLQEIKSNHFLTIEKSKMLKAPSVFAVSLEDQFVHLTWTDNSLNETGFIIQRSNSVNFENFVEFTIDPDIMEFKDEYTNQIGHHFYRIRSYDNIAKSPWRQINISDFITTVGKSKSSFQIFPNPSNGLLEIEFSNDFFGTIDITIYNLTGQQVLHFEFDKLTTQITKVIKTSLPSNVYVLSINTGLQQYNERLIIQ